MFTRITRLLQRNRKIKVVFLSLCFSLLSLYPVFRSFYYGNGIATYKNQIAFLENRSDFYNPWQYRVLCPFLVEGMKWCYDHTIDKLYPIEDKIHVDLSSNTGQSVASTELNRVLRSPGALKYMIVFITLRFLEHLLIFLLAYALWSYFIKNDWLILFGLLFACLGMGNAGSVADLTFNTYLDNILYLLTACIIVFKRNPLWLLPVITIGSLNRETSIMIPFLYFISAMDFSKTDWRRFRFSAIKWPDPKIWLLTLAEYLIFFIIFIAIRRYYGYRPPSIWKVPPGLPMLKLNLLSADGIKAYFEMLGTFSILPLVILLVFRRFPLLLRTWYIGIVPIWFSAHLLTVVCYQTRLFLVPTLVIFIPMFLWLIEDYYKKNIPPASAAG
jgi:hypothetical protein